MSQSDNDEHLRTRLMQIVRSRVVIEHADYRLIQDLLADCTVELRPDQRRKGKEILKKYGEDQ
jgi:hypothetical protein